MNKNDLIYLIDDQEDDYLRLEKNEKIFNKIIDGRINVKDLSVYDLFDLIDYLFNYNNKLDYEINLKKINLLLLNNKLSDLEKNN